MWPWRWGIVAVSLGQLAVGAACLAFNSADESDELGRFGAAVCFTAGGLGLMTQATTFLRPAAVGINALMCLAFLPGLCGGLVRLVAPGSLPPPNLGGVVAPVAAFVAGCAFNAVALYRLPGRSGG